KDLLNWIKVGAVGRQDEQMRALGADGVAGQLSLVTAEVVENDDLALCKSGRQLLLDIKREKLAIDGAIDDPGRADPIVAERRDERHGLPMTERRGCGETLTAWPPAAQRCHVGLDPRLVDEDQAGNINPALVGFPACPL